MAYLMSRNSRFNKVFFFSVGKMIVLDKNIFIVLAKFFNKLGSKEIIVYNIDF